MGIRNQCTQSGTHRPLFLLHICVLWTEFSPTFEPVAAYQYQAVSMFAAVLAMNSMACRIFRLLRELNVDEENLLFFQMSTIHFGGNHPMNTTVQELLSEC